VETPGAGDIGWMQNSGHGRDVRAHSPVTSWSGSWMRLTSTPPEGRNDHARTVLVDLYRRVVGGGRACQRSDCE